MRANLEDLSILPRFQERFSFGALGKKLTELATDAEESVVEICG